MLRVLGKTDTGMVRKQNQDSFKTGSFSSNAVWAVVCDGMGGENGGEIASKTAVESIGGSITKAFRTDMSANSVRTMLMSAICAANLKVYDKAKSDSALSNMGTTVVASVVLNGVAYIAYAGDSRVYMVTPQQITQITRDHTMVQNLIEQGKITSDEAKNHPKKHVITRALGVEQSIDIDYCEIELEPGGVLIICTDGLTNMLEDSEIADIVLSASGEDCLAKLVDEANSRGGQDNITAVSIFG